MSDAYVLDHRCRIVICTPCPLVRTATGGSKLAMVSMQWHRHRMKLQSPYGYNLAELACDGFEVGDARNQVVGKCRDVGAEYLFFIDYDVLLPPHSLKQLLYRATATHRDYDVFSGVYCAKDRPAIPFIYREWNEGPCWDWTMGDVIAPVVGVPMGCTLLRLSLFDRLSNTPEKPWFKTHDLLDGNPLEPANKTLIAGGMTEDMWFCKRAVEEADVKILVDTSIQCGHINHETGEIFTLPEDCPPVLRAGLKLDESLLEAAHA